MLALYVFCAALGIPLLALFAFSSSDSEMEIGEAGFDLDADVGADLDFDLGSGDVGFGDFTGLIRRIPISSYAFFLAFFGAAGTLGTWLDFGFIQTIILAVSVGVLGAGINTAAFSFLRNTDSSSQMTDRQLEGRLATVSVPIDAGRRGRVWLDTGDERLQLTAGSTEGASDQAFARGEQVVIVEMTNGVARVMGIDPEISNG